MSYVVATGEARFESVEALAGQIFDQLQTDDRGDAPAALDGVDAGANAPLVKLGLALAQLGAAAQDKPATPHTFNDIGYHAARERCGLPRGIELLESPPTPLCEETVSASIRRVIVDQKREHSLAALPELMPEDELAEADADAETGEAPSRAIRVDVQSLLRCVREPLCFSVVPAVAVVFNFFI